MRPKSLNSSHPVLSFVPQPHEVAGLQVLPPQADFRSSGQSTDVDPIQARYDDTELDLVSAYTTGRGQMMARTTEPFGTYHLNRGMKFVPLNFGSFLGSKNGLMFDLFDLLSSNLPPHVALMLWIVPLHISWLGGGGTMDI